MVCSDRIPLMFRAQIEPRCQIQRLIPKQKRQQAYDWVEEWLDGVDDDLPQFSTHVQTRSYQITWRFVTNSGQDEGVIRPVIGAKGYPYYPGASMKGAFRRACTDPAEALRYCGGQVKNETQPGILRFHGGYPETENWMNDSLVDVVHPQESWQVIEKAKHSAFIQISLYQPTLIFGISSNQLLEEVEWQRIWEIWETAFGKGIGSRVSAGYGQPIQHKGNLLLSVNLRGQGLASQRIDKVGEFRPNSFKASLRGHTLRLFGGLTDSTAAQALTKELWGGFAGRRGAIVGQVGIAFNSINLDLSNFRYTPPNNKRPFSMPTYELEKGRLDLLCMQKLSSEQEKNLRVLLKNLVKFTFLLGGVGKSWRRIDHRLFFPQYFKHNDKPMIGCHWELLPPHKGLICPINQLSDVTTFLDNLNSRLKKWITLNKKPLVTQGCDWREAWHRDRVQVWGRFAASENDSKAISWFHKPYQNSKTIKKSNLTGRMGNIGRIWHRMYPHYHIENDGLVPTGKFVELLTIFPDESDNTQEFLQFLEKTSDFKLLWGK